ncbi:MAG: ABC transporter permease [Bdellovibrionota bacterium]
MNHFGNEKILKKTLRSPRIAMGLFIVLLFSVAAIFAEQLAPYPPAQMDLSLRIAPPNIQHLFGCDLNGADVLTSILYGARTSLYISFLTVFLSVTVGIFVGLIAGYFKGAVDTIFMRLVDILMAFPGILLAMSLAALMGPNIHNVILAIAATGWTGTARLVRGQVLSISQREFVVACKAVGAGHTRTLMHHILPATWSPIIIQSTFSLSGVILVEASLSFLGLGAQDGPPSWGALLNEGRTVLTEAPHLSIIPGLCIAILVLALNFVGDALRDILDPKEERN